MGFRGLFLSYALRIKSRMDMFEQEQNDLVIMAYLATKLTLTVTAVYGRDVLKGRSSMTESGKHDRDTSPSVMDIFDFNEDEKC